MRRALLFLAKATISVLLLYLSLHWVDVGALGERLSRFESGWIALTLFLLTVQVMLLAVRWSNIATACGANLPFTLALQISFIGAFFNQVLPSTVGGDSVRIWLFARRGAGWASATYSVLIDRIAGIFVLALVVIACLPWTLSLIHDTIARAVLLVIGVGVIAGTLVFVLIGVLFRQWLDRWMLTRHLSAASRITAALCSSYRSAMIVIACSVAIHLITVAAAWCCVKAVAAPVSFAQLLFLMPPVLLIATLPVSIAGWGVRESSFMVAFAYAGLAESDGLATSILFGSASVIVGVVGGVVWIVYGLRMRPFEGSRGSEPVPVTSELGMESFVCNDREKIGREFLHRTAPDAQRHG
jgi:glycosyltransferase 2 family protein